MAEPAVIAIAPAVAASAPSAPIIAIPANASADVIKAVTEGQAEVAQATSQAVATAALQFNVFGYNFSITTVAIGVIMLGILWFAYSIQKQDKLDFADMITFDGRKVSLSKVLQLLGGVTATWVMIKLTLTNSLSEVLFATYLTYVGAVEGYSKFVAAKYGYTETGIKDGGIGKPPAGGNGTSNGSTGDASAEQILQDAAEQATDAEASAKDAKVSIKNAAIDIKNGNH